MWGATACSFLNPWGLAAPYLQRKVRLRRGWCLCPRECTGLKIWSPKSLRKVLSRLRLGSPREIGMVPPVRIVSIENGPLTGLEKPWAAWTCSWINSGYCAAMRQSLTKWLDWSRENTPCCVGGVKVETSFYEKNLVQFLGQQVHFTVDVYRVSWLVNTTFLLDDSRCGPVRSRNGSMTHEIVTQISKSFHASFSFVVMNVPPHDASTIWRCGWDKL